MSNICIEYLLPWCDDVIVMPLLKHFEIQNESNLKSIGSPKSCHLVIWLHLQPHIYIIYHIISHSPLTRMKPDRSWMVKSICALESDTLILMLVMVMVMAKPKTPPAFSKPWMALSLKVVQWFEMGLIDYNIVQLSFVSEKNQQDILLLNKFCGQKWRELWFLIKNMKS